MNLRNTALVLTALAGSSMAMAAPRETVDLAAAFIAGGGTGGVPSFGRQGNPGNTTLTNTFVGGYNANFLSITGALRRNTSSDTSTTLLGTWALESAILVTPPSGTPFIVQPIEQPAFLTDQSTITVPTGAFTVPVAPVAAGGAWSFQFFEYFDDSTTRPDAFWDSLSVTLDDGVAPGGPAATSGNVAATFNDVLIDGLGTVASPASFNQTFAANPSTSIGRVRLILEGTALNADGVAQLGAGVTPLSNVRIRITPPGTTVATTVTPWPSVTTVGTTPGSSATSSDIADLVVGVPAATPVGNWRVEAFTADDNNFPDANAPSAILKRLTVELQEITPPSSTLIALSDGVFVSGTGTIDSTNRVAWFRINLPTDILPTNNGALDISTEGSVTAPVDDTAIALYNAGGGVVASDTLDGPASLGQLSFGRGTRIGGAGGLNYTGGDGATLAAGTYFIAATASGTPTFSAAFTVGATSATATASPVSVNVRYFSNFVPVPPTSTTVTLVNNSTVTETATFTPGQVTWYTFQLNDQVGGGANRALSIDTEGSSTTPTNDTAIALYRENGTLAVSDAADGSGSLGTLTFGPDNRPAPGDGLALDGRDGGLLPGRYYLGVVAGTTPTWGVSFIPSGVSATATGTLTTNFTLRSPSIDTSGVTPPTSTDLGTLPFPTGTPNVITQQFVQEAGSDIGWFRFTTTAAANNTTTNWIDLDTENTGAVDTEIGLYSSEGLLVVSDDDDGSANLSQISIGNGSPVRPAVVTGGALGDGRDGALAAGTYFVAVSRFSTAHGGSNFNVTSTSTTATTLTLNVRSGAVTAAAVCGAADVGVQGGSPGRDDRLNNNDFAAFITLFFASDPRADVGVQGGGAGTDGLFDNNDFAAFISLFFAAPEACRQ